MLLTIKHFYTEDGEGVRKQIKFGVCEIIRTIYRQ